MKTNKASSTPDEAITAFRDALIRGGIEVNITTHSTQLLAEIRTKFGGKTIETKNEQKWSLTGYDAAVLVATTFALRGLYTQQSQPAWSKRPQP
jgi:hypothetical protein